MPPPADTPPPRWRRFLVAVAALTAGQAAAIWFLAGPGAPGSTGGRPPTADFEFLDGTEDRGSVVWSALTSPSLLALASPEGVSGVAWLRARPFDLARTEDSLEPLSLAFQPAPTGPLLDDARAALAGPRVGASQVGPPDLPEFRVSLLPIGPATEVRITGGLAARQLVEAPPWPLPPEAPPGPETVIRLTVDARGEVATPPVVWRSSGSTAADQVALDAAARARFDNVAGEAGGGAFSGLTWGCLSFRWAPPAPAPPPGT